MGAGAARGPFGCWACAALALLLAACVSSPRTASEIARKSEPVTFSGLFEVPGVELELQAKNQRSGAWVRFGSVRTRGDDSVVDGAGRPYFRYATNAVLPQSPDYWIAHVASGRIEAQVRVAYRDRVLTTFAADAESCARRLHELGKSEGDVFQGCAAKDPALARVFVAACGDLGEACCPGKPAESACGGAYSCRSGLCVEPDYPVPSLPGYRVDLSVPPGYRLRDAWLEIDDREVGEDSRRPLVSQYRVEPGVELATPHLNIARLDFELMFYRPGINRFIVRGHAVRGEARRAVASAPLQLEYSLPRQLGLTERGRFQLPAEHFPRLMAGCRSGQCKDADRDGLNDLWENVAIDQLRPRLQLDRRDNLFRSRSDQVRILTSATPLSRDGGDYVVFASVIAFNRDYGHMGIFAHVGDTEAFGMLYRVEPDGALSWVASAAKGHPCVTCASRFQFFPQDFAEDNTPVVYVERDKHGLWQNGRQCRAHAAFSCRGDRSMRPSVTNVGDPSPDGSRGLIDSLDGLAVSGPFGQLAGVFPGDAVWSPGRAKIRGRFCGGRPGCNSRNSASLPGQLIATVMSLFSTQSF